MEWVAKLADEPRQAPSAQSSRPHPYAQDELRGAFGLDFVAYVAYAVNDDLRQVRLLHLSDFPPDEMTFPLG